MVRYGQHVLRIETAVSNAKYDNNLQRITVRRRAPTDSLGCMVSTNKVSLRATVKVMTCHSLPNVQRVQIIQVAWRNHVFLEVTQVRYADEKRRIPGPAMTAGLRVGDIIVSILDDQTVNSLDHFKEVRIV